jgi:hypothetical protein
MSMIWDILKYLDLMPKMKLPHLMLAGTGGDCGKTPVALEEAVLGPRTFLPAAASSPGIGLLFGTIPARKASLASPVTSLRAE